MMQAKIPGLDGLDARLPAWAASLEGIVRDGGLQLRNSVTATTADEHTMATASEVRTSASAAGGKGRKPPETAHATENKATRSDSRDKEDKRPPREVLQRSDLNQSDLQRTSSGSWTWIDEEKNFKNEATAKRTKMKLVSAEEAKANALLDEIGGMFKPTLADMFESEDEDELEDEDPDSDDQLPQQWLTLPNEG
jgi:hypothetical protein